MFARIHKIIHLKGEYGEFPGGPVVRTLLSALRYCQKQRSILLSVNHIPVSLTQKWPSRNFPGGPVAKIPHFQCRGPGV